MAPNKTLAAQLYSELREFFPENAVEYFVSYYDYYQPEAYVPSRDLFIEKDSSINEHIEQMRLSATKSLLERARLASSSPPCRRSTVSATRSDYHGMILHLRENEKMTQRDVIKRLTEMQYERNDIEFKRGVFRVRGDVHRHLPGGTRGNRGARRRCSTTRWKPCTCSIRSPARSCRRCRASPSIPSSHYVTPRATTLRAIEKIKVELRERIEFYRPTTSWSKRSASSSAPASTWKC